MTRSERSNIVSANFGIESTRSTSRETTHKQNREQTEKLRDQFARETDPAKQKEIAAAVQKRNTQVTTHLFLGQYYLPAAVRKNLLSRGADPVARSGKD